MTCRLAFSRKIVLNYINRDIRKNVEIGCLSCASCNLIRNSSILCSNTAKHILSTKSYVANVVQNFGKTDWKNPNKKQKSATEYESDSDSDDETFLQKERAKTEGVKVVQVQVDNLRVDVVIKHAFGIARNKSEVLFYENRIRINGKKPMKKSTDTNVGDEVDIVRGISQDNPNFIIVSRVEILKVRPSGDYLAMTMRKQKNLTIENYDEHPWIEKTSEEVEENNKDKDLG